MIAGHTAVAYENKVYLFGGRNDEMVILDCVNTLELITFEL